MDFNESVHLRKWLQNVCVMGNATDNVYHSLRFPNSSSQYKFDIVMHRTSVHVIQRLMSKNDPNQLIVDLIRHESLVLHISYAISTSSVLVLYK